MTREVDIKRLNMLIRAAGATTTDCQNLKAYTRDTPSILELQNKVHDNAVARGFYDGAVPTLSEVSMRLLLMHSEISEAAEALRDGGPMSKKLPEVRLFDEELSDLVIRTLDLCGWLGIDLEAVIVSKMEYNTGRPYKHGKKF